MFKTIKQKLSNLRNSHSKKRILTIFCMVLFFTFLYLHSVNAVELPGDMDMDTSSIDAGKSMGGIGNPLTWLITRLLGLMLKFVSVLLSGAETLFVYIVDPYNMKAIMDNNAIYTTWRTVRDVFNIAFIMVLLFSAFCTIFQVSKYGIKTIWLNLVLMALLVNFSYPIARFIIDASNMLMYGLLNNLGGTNSFMSIIQKSGINDIIATQSPEPLYLLSAVVFTFILAITLLVIAVLLVIRTVTLAIYIVFSPVAFVGTILPGELGKESGAGGWWDGFLKQCFAGPIIVFMLYIASTMMSAIGSPEAVIKLIADTQVPGADPNPYYAGSLAKLIAQASYFSMPVVILWVGIMTAQKSGIYGAEKAVGYGKTAGKWLAKNPALGSVGLMSKKSGLTGGVKAKWDNWKKTGLLGSDKQAEWEAVIAGKGPFKVKGSEEKEMRRKADNYKKDHTTEAELKNLATSGDAGAAYRLAEDKNMDQDTYKKFMQANKNKNLHKAVNSKVKQNRADIVANYNAQEKVDKMESADITVARTAAMASGARGAATWTDDRVKKYTKMKEVEQEMGKLTAEKFADQDWIEITKEPMTPEKLLAIRGAKEAISGLPANDPALAEIKKRMAPAHRTALKKAVQVKFGTTLSI